MLLRSAHHALRNDARGRTDVARALVCAPLRFALDVLLLGLQRFALAAAKQAISKNWDMKIDEPAPINTAESKIK